MDSGSTYAYLACAMYFLLVSIIRRYRRNSDSAGAERAFIIFLLWLILSYETKAQPTRPWVLTTDSNVVAPYEDIVKATAYRMEVDSLADSYFEESRELEQAKEGLLKSLADCMLSANGKQETIELYKHDLNVEQGKTAALSKKLSGSKAVNKVLVLAAGVMAVILVVK